MRSARSYTATVWPARVSCWAAARPAGPEPMTATVLPDRRSGACGRDVAGVPRLVDDRDFDVLDGDGGLVDAEHARRLAGSRAQPPGELREVVGGVQPLGGGRPVLAVGVVVPLGDQVSERTAVVAERDAAVHAAPGLLADDRQQRTGNVDLVPVLDALARPGGSWRPRARWSESPWGQPLVAASIIFSVVSCSERPASSAASLAASTALYVVGMILLKRSTCA